MPIQTYSQHYVTKDNITKKNYYQSIDTVSTFNKMCISTLKAQPLQQGKKIERVMGIEPTYPAWKAGVLPLNYTRMQCPEPESNQ